MISFKWWHFQKDIIMLVVRWYLSYSLSYRDIEEIMLERGLHINHSTINRWVIQYSPRLENKFRQRFKRKVGKSWRMDETYIKVKGVWHDLYRAVDKSGATIDFMLSKRRDKSSARVYFIKAIGSSGLPEKVVIDKSGSNKTALNAINSQIILFYSLVYALTPIKIRQSKYLNNIVEQDHRAIKRITKSMMGFKSFHSAEATLAGIELCHMLKKNQHVNAKHSQVFEQFYSLAA